DGKTNPRPWIRQYPYAVQHEEDGAKQLRTPIGRDPLRGRECPNAVEQRKSPQRCERRPPKWAQVFLRGGLDSPPVLIEPVKGVGGKTDEREDNELVGCNGKQGKTRQYGRHSWRRLRPW